MQLRRAPYTFIAVVCGCLVISFPTQSATLSKEAFTVLAHSCAPTLDPRILAAVAHVESHFDPFAIRNNTEHLSVTRTSQAAAVAQAKRWILRGDSVDLGLMQINSENLASFGLTVESAFDACRSLESGARALSTAYAENATDAERQAALLIALSRYNTGRDLAGLANGYVGQVLVAFTDNGGESSSSPAGFDASSWNIWTVASAAQHSGAVWLVGSQDTPNFVIGAGAQPSGEPHALSQEPGTAPGM